MGRLANDVTRCSGGDCPMKANCLRHTDIPDGPRLLSWFAAKMWRETKRGPACDHLIPRPERGDSAKEK